MRRMTGRLLSEWVDKVPEYDGAYRSRQGDDSHEFGPQRSIDTSHFRAWVFWPGSVLVQP